MTLLRRAWSRLEQRSAPVVDPFSPPPPGALGQLASSGVVINEDSATQIITVLACVRLLSTTVSMLPLRTYEQAPDGTRRELVPPPKLISDPFPELTLQEGLAQLVYSLALHGNAYAYVTTRDAAMRPTDLVPLHPGAVRVDRDRQTNQVRYRVGGQEVSTGDVFHLRGITPPGSLTGLSVIDSARTGLGLSLATEEFGSRFFRQGASMSGVIEVPDGLEPDDARVMAETFAAKHSGLARSHTPAVVTGGAKWVPTSVSPENAQFLQTRQYQASEIATLFGVPPHLVGLVDKTTSWGTGIEVQGRAFVTYTLRGYFGCIEHALSRLLPPGQWCEFDTDQLTRADTTNRYGQYRMALQDGWMNVDEVRRLENLSPLPDGLGQVYRHPANQLPADADVSGPLPPAEPVPTTPDVPLNGDAVV